MSRPRTSPEQRCEECASYYEELTTAEDALLDARIASDEKDRKIERLQQLLSDILRCDVCVFCCRHFARINDEAGRSEPPPAQDRTK